MSDYKREVYYLYNYENQCKKNNIGFARIEQMNGQCRMTIRVRVMSMNGKTLDVCLFVRECGELRFLPVGTIKINHMAGECRLRLNAENILESGYSLGEMEGMVIYDSLEKFFGSEWKEQKIYFEEFKTISGKKQAKNENGTDEKNEADGKKEKDFNVGNEKGIEYDAAEKEAEKRMEYHAAEKEAEKRMEYDIVEKEAEKRMEYHAAEKEAEKKMEYDTAEKKDKKRRKYDETEKENMEYKNEKQEGETVHTIENEDHPLMAAGLKCGKERNFPKRLPEIFYQCERLNPFEDDEITDCIKIEPQDIGRLPMESWILANNSFLLHSYYSYRHLLLARRSCGGGFEYVLCAPGICQNREEFMAAMFGFCDFKPVKKVEDKKGEFGYWYMPVVL